MFTEVAKARGDKETITERNPVRDSSANGAAEKAAQTLECSARAHLLDVDGKIGQRLPLGSPPFEWLVESCAFMHNRFQVSSDGRTPWERDKKRRFRGTAI